MGKFVVRKIRGGVEFHLHAANGGVIASSDVLAGEDVCLAQIEAVRQCAASAPVADLTAAPANGQAFPRFEIFLDPTGRFCFRLCQSPDETLARSTGYRAKASCRSGIESVRRNAPTAEIVK